MNRSSYNEKKLKKGIAIIIILAICLCITTIALIYSAVSVTDHTFTTGLVKINLNDNIPIISEREFIFEPGMTVKKNFFVKNESSSDAYYKVYFENVQGGLADVLIITIKYGDNVLFQGTASELTAANVVPVDEILHIGERHNLTIFFEFPEKNGNDAQDSFLYFDACAKAVQTKNNPNKLFD